MDGDLLAYSFCAIQIMPFKASGCFCLPQAGFTCKRCAELGQTVNEDFTLDGGEVKDLLNPTPEEKEAILQDTFIGAADRTTNLLTGYGYKRADQDGYDGGEVSPAEHKEEEFFEASRQLLKAQGISESD